MSRVSLGLPTLWVVYLVTQNVPKKHFEVSLVEGETTPISLSVDALLDKLQRVVTHTRENDPTLSDYRLHDISLRVRGGELRAVLDFRR